jgi:8-oxo-dGTP pyrophosphatase MutT (NUDIX family)
MAPHDLRPRLLDALQRPGRDSSDYDLNADVTLHPGRVLRPAAVLVLVNDAGDLFLTKRSAHLKHHPGQIALPGGGQDAGDPTPVAAALRETEEEIGLPRDRVEVLGCLPAHETVTSFAITPVIGLLRGAFSPTPEAGEVDEVFTVPLSHVIDPTMFRIESRRWQGRLRHYYVVPWGPYYIWGATARILRALADRMAP